MERIDGKTRLCGLIGNPVEHTLSPMIHNTLAQDLGINLVYVPFLVEKERLGTAIDGGLALDILGFNVTVPYKKDVIAYVKGMDPLAEAVASVNTLVRCKDGFYGYNTDMSGLYRAMREDRVPLSGERVILLGAGGVGRAVAFLCAMKGAQEIWLLNRSVDRAVGVATEVKKRTGRDCIHAMALTDFRKLPEGKFLAIQATSVGLYPDEDAVILEEPAFYAKIHTGYDLIYRPARTKFMKMVEKAGGRAYNGLRMLVYQGVEAFELWNHAKVTAGQADGIYRLLAKETAERIQETKERMQGKQ